MKEGSLVLLLEKLMEDTLFVVSQLYNFWVK
jgi:hypothetical protein